MGRNPSRPRRDSVNAPPSSPDEDGPKHHASRIKDPMFWVSVITLLAYRQVSETQTANSIAKKALAEANKPYVMYSALYPNHTTDTNGIHLRVGFTLANFGNTPASYLRFTLCDPIIMLGAAPPNLRCTVSEKISDEMVLGPKQGVNFSGPIIDKDDLEATKDEKKTIYILGYVTYQDSIDVDIHGFPEQRVTRFCQKIVQAQVQTIPIPQAKTATTPTPTSPPPPAPTLIPTVPGITPIAGLNCPGFSCIDSACLPLR
jgi:hypothetical protein